REAGLGGVLAAALVVVAVLLCTVAPFVGAAVAGAALGRELDSPETKALAIRSLSAIHAFFVLGLGLMGGLWRQRLRFTEDAFRVFPIPPRDLFAAELIS